MPTEPITYIFVMVVGRMLKLVFITIGLRNKKNYTQIYNKPFFTDIIPHN